MFSYFNTMTKTLLITKKMSMLISTSLLLSFETISVFEYCFVVLFLNSIVIAFSVLTSFEKYCIGFRFHDPELHDFAPIDTRIQIFLNLVDILLKSRKSSNCKGLKMVFYSLSNEILALVLLGQRHHQSLLGQLILY